MIQVLAADSQLYLYQHKPIIALFYILSIVSSIVSSFPHCHYTSLARPQTTTTTTTTTTQTFAFSWFKDDGKNDEVRSQLSENLADASNVIESFKTSQRIGEQSGAALQELASTFVEGTSVDGTVKVTFNGQQMPVGVEIDESYLKSIVSEEGTDGIDKLCSALTDAMQSAHYLSGIQLEEKMQSVYSNLGLDIE